MGFYLCARPLYVGEIPNKRRKPPDLSFEGQGAGSVKLNGQRTASGELAGYPIIHLHHYNTRDASG